MTGVASGEGTWQDPESGRHIFYRTWQPASPHAYLVLIHGFGEHSGRYGPLVSLLAQRHIAVLAPDLWGHGRSAGKRGDIVDVHQCARTLARLISEVAFVPQGASYALFGHSFGGLLVVAWALSAPSGLRSVVAQSPLFEAGFPIPFWQRKAAALLACVWPRWSLRMNLDVAKLSHDTAIVEAYRADPLVHSDMSARSYRSIVSTKDDAVARAQEFRLPLLLLCAQEDQIVSVPAARAWYERLTCEKRLVMFPGCYHELHHEPVREQVAQLVSQWVLG